VQNAPELRRLSTSHDVRLSDENEPHDVFRYRVVRLWELPVETLLTGSLGLLPLAPLTDQAAGQLKSCLKE
jgi:hypothetical protein